MEALIARNKIGESLAETYNNKWPTEAENQEWTEFFFLVYKEKKSSKEKKAKLILLAVCVEMVDRDKNISLKKQNIVSKNCMGPRKQAVTQLLVGRKKSQPPLILLKRRLRRLITQGRF